MKYLLKNPLTNALGLTTFSAFYGMIFILTSKNRDFGNILYYSQGNSRNPFWQGWGSFLASGHHAYLAYILMALSVIVVLMLLFRRRPYDEYHTEVLIQCLAVSTILTLAAIALFYIAILSDPNGIIEKFTLFIAIHWATVVLADLVYVFICRWR